MFWKRSVPKEPKLTFQRSKAEQELKQLANADGWGLGRTKRWDADLDAGTIKFSNPDGFTVTGQVQVIGSYDSLDRTWLWSWANPIVPEPLTRAARLARDFGEKYKLPHFTESLVLCPEKDGWKFTGVALYLSEGTGSYRCPAGTTYVFMTFDRVIIRQILPQPA